MQYYKLKTIFEKREKKKEQERIQILKKIKENIETVLKNYPEIKRAFLFGSILKKGEFLSFSDIDFAVEGMKDENFFRVYSDLENMCGREIQLIEIEKARKNLRKHIIEKGEMIYERKIS